MSDIRPIKTPADYEAALARIDALMDAEPDTPEGDELDVLTDLVELYEAKHVPMGYPSAIAAIEFRMEQAGLTQRDLVPILGSRAKVSEVLSGKRPLTLQMARALHRDLGVPADALLQQPGAALPESMADLDWQRFPVRAMAKLDWIENRPDLSDRAEEVMRDLIARAGGEAALPTLFRKNDHARTNAKTDPYALKAWCWQVLASARETTLPATFKPDTVTPEFLRRVAKLSWSEEGPRLAKEFLANHGIHLVVLEHLPKTHLDGAAFKLADGTPVIGLTLRYDRLDNFWFCLLHELAHVGWHMRDGEAAFIDDLSLRELDERRDDAKESEADRIAEDALIPPEHWEASNVKDNPTPMAVVSLARALEVHPAIIAGRVRHAQRNFRLLTHFVGNGQVKRLFDAQPS